MVGQPPGAAIHQGVLACSRTFETQGEKLGLKRDKVEREREREIYPVVERDLYRMVGSTVDTGTGRIPVTDTAVTHLLGGE